MKVATAPAGAPRSVLTVPRSTATVVRWLDPPFEVLSRGQTATLVDLKESLADHLPVALAILMGSTVVVLFLMTGSLVLPVKALLMNLLTMPATFGLLVLIFQDGRLEGLLDYASQGALEATQPIFLFAVAFGCRPTTASSCWRGSRRRATAGFPTTRRWRSASSALAGS